jgi:archaellum component FlaC
MPNSVQIVLEAVDKTKDALNSVKTSSESLLSSLKSHWLEFTAAGASIYGVVEGLQSFVGAAAEAEKIQSQLSFQVQAAGINYSKVKEGLDAFAASIQDTSRFSSDTAKTGLSQMMQYTVDLGKAMEATKLAMDMSVQTGMDLQTAMRYVGMAMNGDIEILGRMNPLFRNLGDNLGANATQAEKAKYGLEALNKLFGGAAQKDLETYDGQMQHLKNTIAEVQKGIGEKLLGVLDWAKGQEFFQEWWAGVDSLLGITQRQVQAQQKVKDGMAAIAGESQKALDTKALNDYISNWDRWTKQATDVYTLTDELNRAFTNLGITSVRDSAVAADAAVANMERIKKAMLDGKASIKDYQNALLAAKAGLQSLVAPDVTNAMADLQKKYEEGAKAISPEDPEFRKKIEAWADQINEEMKKITGPSVAELEAEVRDLKTQAQAELDKNPLGLKVDTADFMNRIMSAYQTVKAGIESDRIKIQVDTSQLSGSPSQADLVAMVAGGPAVAGLGQQLSGGVLDMTSAFQKLSSLASTGFDANISFTGEGSTKLPLDEKIQEIMGRFTDLQDKIGAMDAAISFTNITTQLDKLEKEYDIQYAAYEHRGASIYGNVVIPAMSSQATELLKSHITDLFNQMKALKLSQAQAEFTMGVPGAEEEFWKIFQSQPAFQTGTPYVPKTGLYVLHKGERVLTTNQVSMSMGGFNFHIYGGDPREIAQQIAKVLKYQVSGDLKAAIKGIRS